MSEQNFYQDLVFKLKKIFGNFSPDFSYLTKIYFTSYRVMTQTEVVVINIDYLNIFPI